MNNTMSPREIFLNACGEIADYFDAYGFNPVQKGQRLKKLSKDKDISFDISFQSNFRNYASSIEIIPRIDICSKELKKWKIEQNQNEYEQGWIYSNNIGYISPYKNHRTWNLAGLSYQNTVIEIIEKIKTCALPIFELFEDKQKAIEFLTNNGTQFNQWTEKDLSCLPFMIYFAEKEQAEIYFNEAIDNINYVKRIKSFYKELSNAENINLNHDEFAGASLVKLAFVNKLKITSE